jgi:hypothetical protein
MTAIADILPSVVVLGGVFLLLLRNSHTRAVVRAIFRRPYNDSTLVMMDDGRWVDVEDPVDATRGHLPGEQRGSVDRTSRERPVRSGRDSHNGDAR